MIRRKKQGWTSSKLLNTSSKTFFVNSHGSKQKLKGL